MLRIFIFLCFLTFHHISEGQIDFNALNIPAKHRQIVLVTTDSWGAATGTMQLYSKTSNGWMPGEKLYDVTVGKNGLAWGRGLHTEMTGFQKKEGDGKAPAGIFELGVAFGYEKNPPPGLKIPYRQSTDRDYFVDDVNSRDYNKWVTIPDDRENDPKKHWVSFERMRRSDHLYELGIVINHNTSPTEKGKGSAIFFHVWRRAGSPTLGCTAMSKSNLLEMMLWLDPGKNPLLIQLPEKEVEKVRVGD